MTSTFAAGRTVSDIMERDVVTVPDSTPIRDVLALMTDHHFTAVPVTQEDRCVGILTATDLLRLLRETIDALHNDIPRYEDCLWAVDLARRKLDESPVRDQMTVGIAVVRPSDTVEEAADEMSRAGVHHLPVVEDGRLVGIVSSMDLVKKSNV